MIKKDVLTVGELAKEVGITVRTLQYYDKEGLLKPSAKSEGGRRLYSKKDMIKLHQILSLKHLGFPLNEIESMMIHLDTPEEVATALEKQYGLIEAQIQNLQSALTSIDALHQEVLQIKTVDFSKYADIISMLKAGNEYYWAWKLFDDTLSSYVQERFGDQAEMGVQMVTTYQSVLDEAVELQMQKESPESEKSLQLAEKWWNMITEFTGGDTSLLSKLMKFNGSKEGWKQDVAAKQKQVDDYIGQSLKAYYVKNGIEIPRMEE